MRAPDLEVIVEIARPPAEVRAWWLEMPPDYRASDPKEQPHRIRTLRRDEAGWECDTYWRMPLGREVVIRETFAFRPDGWDVDLRLPAGLRQRDEFVLAPTAAGTRVRVRVWIEAPSFRARLARPFMMRYARRQYPATWRAAAKLCERDAPRLG